MSLIFKKVAIVGSREFKNYRQLRERALAVIGPDDWIISGGAFGADSFAQRLSKEIGNPILIFYPRWHTTVNGKQIYDKGAGFKRNEKIAEEADIVLAFYQKGRFRLGGTANTAMWARKLNRELVEFEEET